jgi:hypothetical protein
MLGSRPASEAAIFRPPGSVTVSSSSRSSTSSAVTITPGRQWIPLDDQRPPGRWDFQLMGCSIRPRSSFGVDVLLFQPVARFSVDPIETHFFAQRGGRIECNGARDQRKAKVALPVRTRCHWTLLNTVREGQIIAKTLANACDPGDVGTIPNIHSIRP